MRSALLLALALLASACAESHERGADGGEPLTDAALVVPDASRVDDAGAGGPSGLRCGPNVCRTGEICCSESCGICAFVSECVPTECGVP